MNQINDLCPPGMGQGPKTSASSSPILSVPRLDGVFEEKGKRTFQVLNFSFFISEYYIFEDKHGLYIYMAFEVLFALKFCNVK